MKTRDLYDRYRGFRDGIRNITDPSPNHRSYHTGHDEGEKVWESFRDLSRRVVAEAFAKRDRAAEGGHSIHGTGIARYTQGLSDALRGREAQEVSKSSKPYYDEGYQAGREIAARLVGESTGEVIALVGAAAAEGLARSEEFISQLKLRAGVGDETDSRVQAPPSIPEPGRGEDFTTHQRDLDYFARLWTAARMIRDEVRSHVRKGEGTVSTTPAVAALMEAMVLPPDIEAALAHRSVLAEPGPEHLSEEARRGLAETVYARSRRGPREDDPRRSVIEEPQLRVWIVAFRRNTGTAETTVRVDDKPGMSPEEAVDAARAEYEISDEWEFISGESPDHEPFPPHYWMRSDGWKVGVSKEDKEHAGPTRRYLVPLEGDSPPDYGATLIEKPKTADPEFSVPLPEDTPADAARLAEESAVNPDVDEARLCPVHGVRDQDGYGGPQHRCNSIVRKEEGIPILCGEPTSIVQEGD